MVRDLMKQANLLNKNKNTEQKLLKEVLEKVNTALIEQNTNTETQIKYNGKKIGILDPSIY